MCTAPAPLINFREVDLPASELVQMCIRGLDKILYRGNYIGWISPQFEHKR
jgi:hypothetical protein